MDDPTIKTNSTSPGTNSFILFWTSMPAFGQVLFGFMFMFTIWSVFTRFDLGEYMNQYVEATLKQRDAQFEAEQTLATQQFELDMELQKMQFQASEKANDQLETLIVSVGEVNQQMIKSSQALEELTRRVAKNEQTTNLIAKWTCEHGPSGLPDYCEALGIE